MANKINCSELLFKFSPILDNKTIEVVNIFGRKKNIIFNLEDWFRDLFYENDVHDDGEYESFWWWYTKEAHTMTTYVDNKSVELYALYSSNLLKEVLKPLQNYLKENKINIVVNDCIRYIEGVDDDRYEEPYDNYFDDIETTKIIKL